MRPKQAVQSAARWFRIGLMERDTLLHFGKTLHEIHVSKSFVGEVVGSTRGTN